MPYSPSLLASYLPDRKRLATIADELVLAIAIVLPWSTSATIVLATLWLLTVLFALDRRAIAAEIRTAAGALPVLLCLLAILGTLWGDASWHERAKSLDDFARLLAIPLLLAQFRASPNGQRVFTGFLVSCFVLLLVSYVSRIWPTLTLPWRTHGPGIPVKDYIVQSGEFALCAFALLPLAISKLHSGNRAIAIAMIAAILLFIGNVSYVATARTTLLVMFAFVFLFGLCKANSRVHFYATLAALVAVLTVACFSSSYLRNKVVGLFEEVQHYNPTYDPARDGEESAALRLELWKKSIRFIADAPIAGHGTGTIGGLFRRSSEGQTGLSAFTASNPHNQTFAVAIQLGALGVVLVYAMWIAHLLLFRGGQDMASWIGLLVVVQNVVASLFNSHLFDFTQGWLYVLGVGVAGGMVRQARERKTTRAF